MHKLQFYQRKTPAASFKETGIKPGDDEHGYTAFRGRGRSGKGEHLIGMLWDEASFHAIFSQAERELQQYENIFILKKVHRGNA